MLRWFEASILNHGGPGGEMDFVAIRLNPFKSVLPTLYFEILRILVYSMNLGGSWGEMDSGIIRPNPFKSV